ncbi:MAG: DUF4129 domain-containing protein [Acetobacteraceae bacterium]|nr:DUF4129 domain-containing protein [Acetobacteraceae bacterium]
MQDRGREAAPPSGGVEPRAAPACPPRVSAQGGSQGRRGPGPGLAGARLRPAAMEWVILALAAATEVAWLAPALMLLGQAESAGRPLPLLPSAAALAVVATAAVTGLALGASRLRPGVARALAALGGMLAVVLVTRLACFGDLPWLDAEWILAEGQALGDLPLFPAAARVMLVTGFLWWRGVALGAGNLGPAETRRRLLSDGVGLALGLAAASLAGRSGLPRGGAVSGGQALVFLALALGLLSAVNLHELARTGRTALGAGPRSPLRWAASTLAWIAVVGAAALGLGALVSPSSVVGALRLLRPVGRFLSTVLYYLFLPAGYLVWLGSALIGRLGRHTWEEIFSWRPGPPTPPSAGPQSPELPWLLEVARWAAVALLTAGAALAFAKALALRRDRRAPEPSGEVRESLWSWNRLGWILRRGRRRDRGRHALPGPLPAALSPGIRRARALYRAVLRAATLSGSGRRPSETPDEFDPRLARVWRGWGGEEARSEALTAAYNLARYAETDPPPGQVEAAEREWRLIAVRARGRRQSALGRRGRGGFRRQPHSGRRQLPPGGRHSGPSLI